MNLSIYKKNYSYIFYIGLLLSWSIISCSRKIELPVAKNEATFYINRNANSVRLVNFQHDDRFESSKYSGKIRGEIAEILSPMRSWNLVEAESTLRLIETGKNISIPSTLNRNHFPESSINDTSSFLQFTPFTKTDMLFTFLPIEVRIGTLSIDTFKINMTINSKFEFSGASIDFLEYSGGEYKLPKVEIDFWSMSTAAINTATIQDATLGEININQKINHLILKDCRVETTTQITGIKALDTLTLDNVWFSSESALLDITQLTTGNSNSRTILRINKVPLEKIRIDYKKTLAIPFSLGDNFNTNYRNSIEFILRSIMDNQKEALNDKGYELAAADLSKYHDSKKPLGWVVVSLKSWWNNYGLDKERVVRASFVIYLFCALLNMLWRKALKETYPIKTIEEAFILTKSEHNQLRKVLRWLFLNLTYTAYIFFGIKLDIEKLQLGRFRAAMWVVFQYVLGIICLAYIANLILSK